MEPAESTEAIRQQMEETKLQLAEKLETLEQQVAESVQATEAVVSATVETVQDTVESVNTAVHSAISSIGYACDLSRHVRNHPVLVLGGAAIVGFLVGRSLVPRHRRLRPRRMPEMPAAMNGDSGLPVHPLDSAGTGSITEPPPVLNEPTPEAAELTAADDTGFRDSVLASLQGVAIAAAGKVVQEVTSRAVPFIIDRLFEEPSPVARDAPDHPSSTPALRAARFD